MHIFIQLLMMHALCDFAIQNKRMALGKSKDTNEIEAHVPWYYWLTAHALIQGGGVAIITGSVYLGLLETFLHWWVDHCKCIGKTNIHTDQLIHILCLAGYVLILKAMS